jgi:hypothetical protein
MYQRIRKYLRIHRWKKPSNELLVLQKTIVMDMSGDENERSDNTIVLD